MKKLLLLCVTAMLLTVPAYADVIGPVGFVVMVAWHYLPYLLVIAVVIATAILLRKKKK